MAQRTLDEIANRETRLLLLAAELAALHDVEDVASLAGRVEFVGERVIGAAASILALTDDVGAFRVVPSPLRRPAAMDAMLTKLRMNKLGESESVRAAIRVAELSDGPLQVPALDLFPGHDLSQLAPEFLVIALTHAHELLGGLLFAVRPDRQVEEIVRIVACHVAVSINQLRRQELARRLHAIDKDLGVPDEQYLRDQLRREVSRARRYDRSVGIAYVDLANRDEIRSAIGDFQTTQLLRRVGAVVLRNIRDTDVLATLRSGYGVIHTDTSKEGTRTSAQRLAVAIRERVGRAFNATPNIQLIVRCAAYPADADTPDDLLEYLFQGGDPVRDRLPSRMHERT